jgi:uncharacterized membrane protein
MHLERVVITRVSAVIATVVAITIVVVAVVVAATVGAFGSLLLGHLFPNIQIIIISSGGRPRARATIVGVVTIPIVLRLGPTPPCSPSASCLGCALTFERE